jgi:hypothetical protein
LKSLVAFRLAALTHINIRILLPDKKPLVRVIAELISFLILFARCIGSRRKLIHIKWPNWNLWWDFFKIEGVRGHDRQIAIGRYFAAYCSSAQRRLRGGRGSVTHAVEAGGRENEPAIGGLSGLSEGRSTVQQLLFIPGTEWLHPRRWQYKPDRLV